MKVKKKKKKKSDEEILRGKKKTKETWNEDFDVGVDVDVVRMKLVKVVVRMDGKGGFYGGGFEGWNEMEMGGGVGSVGTGCFLGMEF